MDDATDAFRIKIWGGATSTVVFDNQMNADDNVTTLLNKVSGGGSIVIHWKVSRRMLRATSVNQACNTCDRSLVT